MLEVSNISSSYGKIQVLWGVSLNVQEKEIVALVGANGAGKSTVLNIISGLMHPTSGTVSFLGKRIDRMSPQHILELGISYIPEGRRLFPGMTVQENLELGAYLPKAWKKRKKTIEQIYHMFPILEERARQLARTLSGGEQQMLTIGRGLMTNPSLCMFDETSYGLSPVMTINVLKATEHLRDQGTTVLLIEQNVKRALEIADRAYVLENGRIALEGRSQEILQNEHVRVAYLGL